MYFQGGTEARYQNYLSIYKNLKFSALPWYDLQVYSDEENHTTRQAIKLRTDANSDSASDTEMPNEVIVDDAIQVTLVTALLPQLLDKPL